MGKSELWRGEAGVETETLKLGEFLKNHRSSSGNTEVEVFLDKRVRETRQTAGANSRRNKKA